jgi:hypothetical protein
MSQGVREWSAQHGKPLPGSAMDYDPELIPFYVEYHVAPTVEAIMQASEATYGDPLAVSIALGSLNNGGSATARDWLDMLLSYPVKGDYAPGLAGMAVKDLIDIITVHYVGSSDKLAPIWDAWNGVGRIRGLWTTEEVGHKSASDGFGAAEAIQVFSDHLNWYYERGLGRDQARVAIYDWGLDGPVAGTSADAAMTTFRDFFGDVALESLSDGASATVQGVGVETRVLTSADDDRQRAIVLNKGGDSIATVDAIHFDKRGWTGLVSGTLHIFTPAGHTIAPVSIVEESSAYSVLLPSPVPLQNKGYAMLITLQRQ